MRSPLLVTAAALTTLAAVSTAPAVADGTYHSAHILLAPAAGTSAGSGFVENAHANGPNVAAHEQYQLRGAMADTDYQVTLHLYLTSPTCTGAADFNLDSAVLTTNAAGNAAGKAVFTPTDAAPLPKGVPLGVVWTVSAGPTSTYTSGCETVVLD
jgi:hypothetical protein